MMPRHGFSELMFGRLIRNFCSGGNRGGGSRVLAGLGGMIRSKLGPWMSDCLLALLINLQAKQSNTNVDTVAVINRAFHGETGICAV